MGLVSGEENTIAMDLSPEAVNQGFWKLHELEGHQIVLTVKPGTSVSEDEWLFNLSLAFLSTTIDTDDVVQSACGSVVSVLPDLTAILRWLEVEGVNLIAGRASSTFIAKSFIAVWTEVPAAIIPSPSEQTGLALQTVSELITARTAIGAGAAELTIEPLARSAVTLRDRVSLVFAGWEAVLIALVLVAPGTGAIAANLHLIEVVTG
jgi:hypothetical protein